MLMLLEGSFLFFSVVGLVVALWLLHDAYTDLEIALEVGDFELLEVARGRLVGERFRVVLLVLLVGTAVVAILRAYFEGVHMIWLLRAFLSAVPIVVASSSISSYRHKRRFLERKGIDLAAQKGDKGDTGPPGKQGPRGLRGLRGVKGEKGKDGS